MTTSTATSTVPGPCLDPLSKRHNLSSSISSLDSRSPRHQASSIAKAYRQAAQLFLTRRLPEALSTIEPVISPPSSSGQSDGQTDGEHQLSAPVASASRGTRIKVWSFYLTFLNAVVELGPEEGKHAFGSARWKALAAKAKDGSVWDDVVRDGYWGVEGDVDAEVVVNLATLLLTHSPTQTLTQTRLESYLSASAHPTFDVASHMSRPTLDRRSSNNYNNNNGTSTPRDLHTRLKLLELYTLHVLPRNDQWDYAQSFINMSETLDDERREAFLQALQGLRDERENIAEREAEVRRLQEEQRMEAEARHRDEERAAEEARRRIEEEERHSLPSEHSNRGGNSKGTLKKAPAQNGHRRTPSTPPRSSRSAKKAMGPPSGLYKRASSLLSNIQTVLMSTAHSMTSNPMAWLRMMLFLLAFLLAFGRREVRERVQRVMVRIWRKLRGTVGMGVRVSYI